MTFKFVEICRLFFEIIVVVLLLFIVVLIVLLVDGAFGYIISLTASIDSCCDIGLLDANMLVLI